MKLLEVPEFFTISNSLSGYHNEHRFICRLEAYSCKMAGADKKLYKQLTREGGMNDMHTLSPPTVLSSSPGMFQQPLDEVQVSKKTLYFLKSTLNAAFSPEYDFSESNPSEFCPAGSVNMACQNIAALLTPVLGEHFSSMAGTIWDALETVIEPSECEAFQYCGDGQDDPFSEEGIMWSFVYFFYNKKLKRMVLFSGINLSESAPIHDNENQEELPEALIYQSTEEYVDMLDDDDDEFFQ
eukprot:m.136574 g.136574  ORF g.136574 m.136574 type:complete len:240 (-) comp10750_c0_seq1:220-939(-)